MCMGSKAPKPVAPAPPPPPPPVLEQNAPETGMATETANAAKRSSGSKPYRTSLNISGGGSSGSSGGLSVG